MPPKPPEPPHALVGFDARAFRDATNVRVPEHAPFFVFALFRVDEG
jgi:hypothetical protein